MGFSPLEPCGPLLSGIGESVREEKEGAVGKGVLSFSNIEDEDEDEAVPLSRLTMTVTPLGLTASTASPSFIDGGRLEDNPATVSALSCTLGGTGGAAFVVGEVIGRFWMTLKRRWLVFTAAV